MSQEGLKVLALFDTDENHTSGYDFRQELKQDDWSAEADVLRALKELGHDVHAIGIHNDFNHLLSEVGIFKPNVVFNLMEQFNRDPEMAANVAALIEMLGIPYTGADPQALRICKNKSLAKKILTHHEISNPHFQVLRRGKAPKRDASLEFPILLKPMGEDASYGISQNSFVEDDKGFEERVQFIHENRHDAIAEEYIDGRELYVGCLGNERVRIFPPREMTFGEMPEDGPRIATFKAKWDKKFRKKWKLRNKFAEGLEEGTLKKIDQLCRDAYRALELQGYIRMDLRLRDKDQKPFLIEVNPNPHIGKDEDFAKSADKAGLPYPKLIQKILDLAIKAEE